MRIVGIDLIFYSYVLRSAPDPALRTAAISLSLLEHEIIQLNTELALYRRQEFRGEHNESARAQHYALARSASVRKLIGGPGSKWKLYYFNPQMSTDGKLCYHLEYSLRVLSLSLFEMEKLVKRNFFRQLHKAHPRQLLHDGISLSLGIAAKEMQFIVHFAKLDRRSFARKSVHNPILTNIPPIMNYINRQPPRLSSLLAHRIRSLGVRSGKTNRADKVLFREMLSLSRSNAQSGHIELQRAC
ncbi:hypothetical protein M501DRAFT_533625 [Patellaria atrata CBS 101060]|uniref:Uncharacterized protein n=1 Tax=Patellaria atrata CBS 101060 TaxID=1346257 RepID=A0A9P4VV40_9PEZI|nr:hypothetical protein M501DRAFT_533625 [Patellaria atrata CBS 101060]